MAKAVAEGDRVVLVTCTRGELGEIVVPHLDTEANQRRLGELRAAELEAALGELAVSEWDNLGYRDSGMMDDPGNHDPRSFWRADLDEAVGRLVWLVRRYQPDVITTYNEHGGYGHPDHIRTHQVAVGAFARAGGAEWYPDQLGVDGLEPWTPRKLYEQAIPASTRLTMAAELAAAGKPNPWMLADDATDEERARFEERAAMMLVPDERVTTWIDIAGEPLEAKWRAVTRHVTQISGESFFMALGIDAWRRAWSREAFVLRESRVETTLPETDLFAGLR
jgi:LmbE family N-acetylglucosaminyl deacetylase